MKNHSCLLIYIYTSGRRVTVMSNDQLVLTNWIVWTSPRDPGAAHQLKLLIFANYDNRSNVTFDDTDANTDTQGERERDREKG